MKGHVWTIGLVAMLASLVGVVFGAALIGPPAAHAKTGSSSDDVVIVTGNIKGGSQDVLYVVDTRAERLCVFEVEGRNLKLAAARNIKYDLQLHELPDGQKPGLKKLAKDTKEAPDPPSTGARKLLAATGNFLSDQHDLLYVYDTQSRRLVIYEYNNNRLDILAARMITFDLKLDEWPRGRHKPSVKEVYDMIKGD